MNIYNYHNKPESLIGHHKRHVLIAQDAYNYIASNPEGEDKVTARQTISKDPTYSLKYAMYVLHDRFPEGEDAIAKDASAAKEYAEYVLLPLYKAGKIDSPRFYKGEYVLSKAAHYIYFYARDIIKGRWPEGEHTLLAGTSELSSGASRVSKFILWYVQDIIKGPWPEAEKVMSNDSGWMEEYHYELTQLGQ
jgi:hypothetical protein